MKFLLNLNYDGKIIHEIGPWSQYDIAHVPWVLLDATLVPELVSLSLFFNGHLLSYAFFAIQLCLVFCFALQSYHQCYIVITLALSLVIINHLTTNLVLSVAGTWNSAISWLLQCHRNNPEISDHYKTQEIQIMSITSVQCWKTIKGKQNHLYNFLSQALMLAHKRNCCWQENLWITVQWITVQAPFQSFQQLFLTKSVQLSLAESLAVYWKQVEAWNVDYRSTTRSMQGNEILEIWWKRKHQ